MIRSLFLITFTTFVFYFILFYLILLQIHLFYLRTKFFTYFQLVFSKSFSFCLLQTNYEFAFCLMSQGSSLFLLFIDSKFYVVTLNFSNISTLGFKALLHFEHSAGGLTPPEIMQLDRPVHITGVTVTASAFYWYQTLCHSYLNKAPNIIYSNFVVSTHIQDGTNHQ